MDVFEAAERYLIQRDDWVTRAAQIVLGVVGGVLIGMGAVLWFLQLDPTIKPRGDSIIYLAEKDRAIAEDKKLGEGTYIFE